MKRRSPIALSLAKSSKSAMMAAIEIHNKPQISYRYEIVVLLLINAWELLLKAYIYKNLKDVRLFNDDGTTKPFPECVACVFSNLEKNYLPVKENIELLYEYRNKIAHFYTGILDPVIFMLVKKSVFFFKQFLNQFFKIDLARESNLYLLPIGFKPLYTPVDYLSKHSAAEEHPTLIRSFIDNILQVSERLHEAGLEESIIADFSMGIINVKRIKNADIIVALTQGSEDGSRSVVIRKKVEVVDADDPHQSKVVITRDKSESSGTIMHEELSEGLFEEINNLIAANRLMSPSIDQFHLGEEVYYRIYAEREHVDREEKIQVLLAKTAFSKYYAPGLYWFLNLDATICASLILDFVKSMKHPYVHSFLRLVILLGDNVSSWLENILKERYGNHSQRPTYYWTFRDMRNRKAVMERRLLALRMSANKRLELPGDQKPMMLNDLLKNTDLASQYLSKACFNVFSGIKSEKNISRILDILAYGKLIEEKANHIAKALKEK